MKSYANKLGVYDYNSKTGVYQQRSIHFSKKPRYLSQSKKSNKWFVGSIPRSGRGWLYNPATSSSVPTKGWQYNKEGEGFVSAASINAVEGVMEPCRELSITLSGAAANKHSACCRSLFTLSDSWLNGRPIYTNRDGFKLHFGNEGGWLVGSKYYVYKIKSIDGPIYPNNAEYWQYWDGEVDQPATVEIACPK